MKVRWNKPNVWSIGTGIMDGSVVQLVAGINDVPADKWESIKKHPEVIARMAKDMIDPKRGMVKMLEVLDVEKAVDAAPAPVVEAPVQTAPQTSGDDEIADPAPAAPAKMASLSSVSVKEAKNIIAETSNVELLKEWDEKATRDGVKKAIASQLKSLEVAE